MPQLQGPSDHELGWTHIARRNINDEAISQITAKDYRAAGIAMANGVIDRTGGSRDIQVEADAAQLLWNSAPDTADHQFLELLGGYRDTLHEYVNRGNER